MKAQALVPAKPLVASQVSLSLVLFVGAGMFLQTLSNYSRLNPGFDRDHILSVHLDTDLVGYRRTSFRRSIKD